MALIFTSGIHRFGRNSRFSWRFSGGCRRRQTNCEVGVRLTHQGMYQEMMVSFRGGLAPGVCACDCAQYCLHDINQL